MEFWENLSGGTKAFVVIGAILMLIMVVMRLREPAADAPVPPAGTVHR